MRRTLGTLSLAAALAMSLTVAVAPSPAMANTLGETTNLAMVTTAETPSFEDAFDQLPVLETPLGRGAALGSDPAGRVDLHGTDRSGSAVLARITLLDPAQTTVVFTGDPGVPILRAEAGTTASTTVLLHTEHGSVALWSTQPSAIRFETLAAFDGTADAPGATVALREPVTRADTASGLGGNSLTSAESWFGLTGEGGVPSKFVRSAYLTLSVTLEAADTLILGSNQRFELPAGTSTLTTLVTPDAAGGVTARLRTAGIVGALRADVLGWVPDASVDTSRANSSGSFVPATELGTVQKYSVTPTPQVVPLAETADVTMALALVSASSTSRSETSTLAWGGARGRAHGVAVDASAGSLPQLALVPVSEGGSRIAIRRGEADVTVRVLGGFLAAVPAVPAHSEPAELLITSPQHNDTLDISSTASFELTGTLNMGDHAVDRVEITSPSVGFIGTAEVSFDDDEITWSVRLTAPTDGTYTYDATVFDRADTVRPAASSSITVTLDVPEADDIVTNPELEVLDDNDADDVDPPVEVRSPTQLAFNMRPTLEPGDLVVVDVRAGAPDGFLGRVLALNLVGTEWIVDTEAASLEDVLLQADIDETFTFDDGSRIAVDEIAEDATDPENPDEPIFAGTYLDDAGVEQPIETFETAAPAAPGQHVRVATDAEVDLASFDNERAPGDGQEPIGDEIAADGTWAPTAGTVTPEARSHAGELGARIHSEWALNVSAKMLVEWKNGKPAVSNNTGMNRALWDQKVKNSLDTKASLALELEAQAGVSLDFVLKTKVDFGWKPSKWGVTVREFTVKVTTKLKAETGLKAAFEVSRSFGSHQKLGTVSLPTIRILVGTVPVIVTNDVNLKAGLTFTGTAAVSVPAVGVERTDQFGFTYSSTNGLRRIKNDPRTTYPTVGFAPLGPGTIISAELQATVGPEVGVESLIYGFAGPEFTLYAHGGVSGKLSASPANIRHVHAQIEFFLAYGLNGHAKLKLLRWNILDTAVFDLSWRTVFWNKEWEFDV